MAVTLDATLSGATSNSYIDMTEALAIAQNIPGGGEWSVLDEEARNLSLIVATRWFETLTYGGDRCKATQRLKWPRSGVSCDGSRQRLRRYSLSDSGSRSQPGHQIHHRPRVVSWKR